MFEAVLVSAACQGIVEPLPSSHPFASLICSLPGSVKFFDFAIVRSPHLGPLTDTVDHIARDTMSPKSSPPSRECQPRIHLPSLIGFKTFPDDGLPLHTDSRVRAHVPHSWKRGWILVVGFLCVL